MSHRAQLAHHDALIREMAAAGSADREIAYAVGASESGVTHYREREGIKSEHSGARRYQRVGSERPSDVYASLAEADDLFAMQMAERRFASVKPDPIGRITGRVDPAIGMGASSAWTTSQAGTSRTPR